MSRLRPHSVAFTLLLGSLVTLASFATDMGLPVLAATAASLGVTAGRAALTLSIFMAGFALGPLLFAPLSDARGRRPILLLGSSMFALFGGLAALSQSLTTLLLFRLLMGMGAGACQVTVIAMIRDLFSGTEARVKQSYVNLAAGVAPVIAPTIGVGIAALGGWRAIYGVLGVGGTLLFSMVATQIPESLSARAPRGALSALLSYVDVVRHRVTLGYILIIALNFGCLFAYITGSSLVLIGLLGVSRRVYGLLFAVTAFGLMVGALSSARLSRQGISHATLIAWGLGAIVVTAIVLLALTFIGWLKVWLLVPIAFLGFIGQGLVRPNATQGALEPMAGIAGVASAVMTGIQTLTGAASSALVAALFDGRSALAMTAMMALCAIGSTAVYLLVVRPQASCGGPVENAILSPTIS
jgi:DHA1 family bicyclomycin/chloramphenicol resistance-like MFS transporter